MREEICCSVSQGGCFISGTVLWPICWGRRKENERIEDLNIYDGSEESWNRKYCCFFLDWALIVHDVQVSGLIGLPICFFPSFLLSSCFMASWGEMKCLRPLKEWFSGTSTGIEWTKVKLHNPQKLMGIGRYCWGLLLGRKRRKKCKTSTNELRK